MPGLIAVDLDGTIIGPDLVVPDAVPAAFDRARAAGWRTLVATGRMFRSALPYARRLGIVEPLITYQGAWVRHCGTLETWWHRVLPADPALAVVESARSLGLHINLYRDDVLRVERLTTEAQWYCTQSGVTAQVELDLRGHAHCATKLVIVARPEVLDGVESEFKSRFSGQLNVVRSSARYLEFSHLEATKGKALQGVAQRLGIAMDEVVAFGDADNDADMLAMVGLGVSVGEASPLARRSARRHVAAVGLGVVAVIDELLEGAIPPPVGSL